jgi:uncharacterized LabA/DUF88 family protein
LCTYALALMMTGAQEDHDSAPPRIAVLIDAGWFIKAASRTLRRRGKNLPELLALRAFLNEAFAQPRPAGVRVVRNPHRSSAPELTGTLSETRYYDGKGNKKQLKKFEDQLSVLSITPLIRQLRNRPVEIHYLLNGPIERWFYEGLARVLERADAAEDDELTDSLVASALGLAPDDPELRRRPRDPAHLAAVARERFVESIHASNATRQEQKGVDVQLALDIYARAERGEAEHVVVVTGDGDLAPALELGRTAARDRGRLVGMWVLIPEDHSKGVRNRIPGVANDLIDAADGQVLLSKDRLASIFPPRRHAVTP